MEANCFIYPSPTAFDITPIQHQIVLIPKITNRQHLPFSPISHSAHQLTAFLNQFQALQQPQITPNRLQFQKSTLETEVNDDERSNCKESFTDFEENQIGKSFIPCFFLRGKHKKLVIFYHANGEDLILASQFLKMFHLATDCSVLAMEYEGYSIYYGSTTSEAIQRDADRILDFLIENRVPLENIILFGRSIGCAVALSVCRRLEVGGMVLLSPFISLKAIAKELYGSCAALLLKEGFNNMESSKLIKSPTLIIHGLKDTLVSYSHSLTLFNQCQSFCELKLVENMSHTRFNFRQDFITHFQNFLERLSVD